MRILKGHELDDLVSQRLPRESFGPDSEWPYLAFDLENSAADHSYWLQSLPCPVIGIGRGELAKACDVLLEDVAQLNPIVHNVEKTPLASMVLVQHLRASETLNM